MLSTLRVDAVDDAAREPAVGDRTFFAANSSAFVSGVASVASAHDWAAASAAASAPLTIARRRSSRPPTSTVSATPAISATSTSAVKTATAPSSRRKPLLRIVRPSHRKLAEIVGVRCIVGMKGIETTMPPSGRLAVS